NRDHATFLLNFCIHGGLGHLRLQIINEVGFDPTSMHGKWTIGRQFLAWLIKFWCKVGVLYHTAVERQDGPASGNTHLCQRALQPLESVLSVFPSDTELGDHRVECRGDSRAFFDTGVDSYPGPAW